MADSIEILTNYALNATKMVDKYTVLSSAEMLAFAYGFNGRYAVNTDDLKLYVYDGTYTSATTGHFKPASSDAVVFTDVITLPTTDISEQTIYRKPITLGDARHYYVMNPEDYYTVSAAGILNIHTSVLTSWADINADRATWIMQMVEVDTLEESTVVDYDNEGTDTLIDRDSYRTGYSIYYYKGNAWTLIGGGGGSSDYNDLSNKPKVNNITLTGNKTSKDLKVHEEITQAEYDALADKDTQELYCISDGIPTPMATDYTALNNKPQINNVIITGNQSSADLGLASNADVLLKQNSTDNSLQTDNKTIVGAINSLLNTVRGMSGGIKIKVVSLQPVTGENNTMYFIGSASPYTMKLYTTTQGWTDLGTTAISLDGYLKIADIINDLTTGGTQKVLSAEQGKELNTNKQDKSNLVTAFGGTPADDKYPSEKLVKDNLDLKATLANMTDVGYIYETTKTDETVSTLADRFGGTWEAMSDRIEDSWKTYPCTWVNSAGTITSFILKAKVTEDKAFVDVSIDCYLSISSVSSTSSEYEIANTFKINGALFSVAGITYLPFLYFDNTNNSQTCAIYFSSGSNKVWFGANKAGSYTGRAIGRGLMTWTSTFTPDRIIKRFRRTA